MSTNIIMYYDYVIPFGSSCITRNVLDCYKFTKMSYVIDNKAVKWNKDFLNYVKNDFDHLFNDIAYVINNDKNLTVMDKTKCISSVHDLPKQSYTENIDISKNKDFINFKNTIDIRKLRWKTIINSGKKILLVTIHQHTPKPLEIYPDVCNILKNKNNNIYFLLITLKPCLHPDNFPDYISQYYINNKILWNTKSEELDSIFKNIKVRY